MRGNGEYAISNYRKLQFLHAVVMFKTGRIINYEKPFPTTST